MDLRSSRDKHVWKVFQLFTQSLVEESDDLRPILSLAKSIEIENDRVFRFKLKEEAQFHDGKKLSSEDLKFSFLDAVDVKSRLRPLLAVVDRYETPSSAEFEIHLKKQTPAFLMNAVRYIRVLPKHLAEKKSFRRFPIGSGKYKFSKKEGRDLIFRAVDKKQIYQKVIFRTVRSPTMRFYHLISGKADALLDAPDPILLDEAKKNPRTKVIVSQGKRIHYLGFNLRKKKWDAKKRNCLKQALDVESALQGKMKQNYLAHDQLILPQSFFYKQNFKNSPMHQSTHQSTLPSTPCAPMELSILTSHNENDLKLLQRIQAQLRKKKIFVKLQSAEFASFYSSLKNRNFDLFFFAFSGDKDPDYLFSLLHSSASLDGPNHAGLSNAKIDQLLNSARSEKNEEIRKLLYHEIQQSVLSENYLIPLWIKQNSMIVSSRLNLEGKQSYDWKDLLKSTKIKSNVRSSQN